MINLHNNKITTNKRKLYFLLTIPFLTLTNIPNIIFSYDNDVWATRRKQSFNRQSEELWKARELTSDLFNAIKNSNSDSNEIKQIFIELLHQLSILDENNFNNYSNPMTIANLFNNLSKKMKKNEIEGILEGQSINWFENTNNFLSVFVEQIKSKIGFFKPVELANTFNGFGQIGFVRNDFFNVLGNEDNMINFLGLVLARTQSEIESFKPVELANTFNGFGQIGFDRNDFVNALESENNMINFLGSVLARTRNTIGFFKPVELSNTFNGFVTIFLYDNEESNYYSKYFEDIITNIISNIKVKKDDFKDLGEFTINNNIFFLKNVLGIDLDTNGISFLSEDLSHLDNNVKTKQMSNLEQTALEQIRKSGIVKTNTKIEIEKIISYEENGIRIHHPFDFYFKTEDNKDVYLEVDGPHHFIDSKQRIKTPSTIIRDKINKKMLLEKEDTYYLTIPERIINEGGVINYIKDELKGKLNIKENSEEEEQVGTTTEE